MSENLPKIIIKQRDGTRQNLLWDSRDAFCGELSLPALQERYQDETTDEFISFIWSLGESDFGDRKLWQVLSLDGFSAWWVTRIVERHPHFYDGILYDVFKIRAMERYIEKNIPSEIICINLPKFASKAIEEICIQLNVRFASKTKKISYSQLFKFNIVAPLKYIIVFVSTLKRFVLWWWNVRRKFSFSPCIRKEKGIVVGTWWPNYNRELAASGIYRSHYLEKAHEILDQSGNFIHWFFIYAGPDAKITEEVEIRNYINKKNPNCDMVFWEECLSFSDALISIFAWSRFMYILLRVRKSLNNVLWKGSRCQMFPIFESSLYGYSASWHLLRNLFILKATISYCKSIGPQISAFTTSEMQFWERPFFWALRRTGCAKLYAVIHSIITPFRFFYTDESWGNRTFQTMMPDKVLCNGKNALCKLEQNGFPHGRLGAVEAVRYLYLADMRPYFPCRPRKLLVVTSIFREETCSLFIALDKALRILTKKKSMEIIIKPHPFLAVQKLVQRYLSCPVTIETGRIENYLTNDSIVLVTSGTSVVLQVAKLQIPMIVFGPKNNFDMGGATLKDLQYVYTAEEIKNAIEMPRIYSLPVDFFFLNKDLCMWKKFICEN